MQENSSLTVRLDEESKAIVAAVAELRRVCMSDYVRSVIVQQATRELVAAKKLDFRRGHPTRLYLSFELLDKRMQG